MKIKKGFLYQRVLPPLWLIGVGVVSIFAPKFGHKVIMYYVEGERKRVDDKVKRLSE